MKLHVKMKKKCEIKLTAEGSLDNFERIAEDCCSSFPTIFFSNT